MTKEQIQALLKEDKKAVDYTFKEIGKDELNLPSYEIVYINNPLINYRLVRLVEAEKIAVLQDLDYVAVTDEVTTN